MEGLDVAKFLKLAVIHDLAEAVYGDIPATEQSDGSDKQEKRAMNELLSAAPSDDFGVAIVELYGHDLLRRSPGGSLDEFRSSVREQVCSVGESAKNRCR